MTQHWRTCPKTLPWPEGESSKCDCPAGRKSADASSGSITAADKDPAKANADATSDQRRPVADQVEQVEATKGLDALPCLPASFWNARDTLAHIRNAAWSCGRSGDVALFGVMTRIASLVSHDLRFDAGIGQGSLNLYAAIVGRSGAGKSTGVKIAEDLVPIPSPLHHDQKWLPIPYLSIGMGTGEGLIEAYYGEVEMDTGEVDARGRPRKAKVRQQVRHNLFCYVDEGAQIVKQMERQGSVAGAVIRSMWGGEAAGQQNADATRTRYIPGYSYSLGLLIGFQESTALPFLSGVEANMGTPQRFLWGGVYDPSLPDEDALPVHPGELKVDLLNPNPVGMIARARGELRTGVIGFPQAIKTQMRTEQVMRTRGLDRGADPLNAHEPLMKCKVASILAIIDNRFEVNSEDWELAQIVWETNCAIRDGLIEYAKKQTAAEAEARTMAHIRREIRTQEEVRDAESQNRERIARHLSRLVHAAHRDTRGSIRRSLAGRDKPEFEKALELAIEMSWVAIDGDKDLIAGPSVPA